MRPDLTLHAAQAADHADFARFVRELHTDDPVPELERWLADMAPSTFFLRDASGANVAYAYVEVFAVDGYVRHLVVDAAHRGRGVGRAAMEAAAARLRERGCTRWRLNVKRDNAVAIALYESFGLRVQYATHAVRFAWSTVPSLPRAANVMEVGDVAVEHDAGIEQRFGLPSGMLAHVRRQQGSVLMQGRRGGRPVAFARFNPAFPGAFPFRVESTDDTHDLLAALQPHARAGDAYLQLVVEDDERTAAMLLGAGATEIAEIVHLRGDLPRA
jgi:GNAT superfamily N-acetyltransferase